MREFKYEGGGLTFFSDMSPLVTSKRKWHTLHGDYGSFHGVLSFNTSLLSFSHGRMIRPLGDGDVSGITDFNINNNVSLSMVSLPDEVPGYAGDFYMSFYNNQSTLTHWPQDLLPCRNKLTMATLDSDSVSTNIYTFDWGHLMPDETRATFDGTEYHEQDGTPLETFQKLTTHRNWGSFIVNSDGVDDIVAGHVHNANTDLGHADQQGSFRLAGTLASVSEDASTGDLNFMVPGSITLRAGGYITPDYEANNWDGLEGGGHNNPWIGKTTTQHGGIWKPGDVKGLQSTSSGSLSKPSLLSNWWYDSGEKKSPFHRRGAFIDMVAIYTVRNDYNDSVSKGWYNYTGEGWGNTENSYNRNYFAGHSYARKIIASYSTTGKNNNTPPVKVRDNTTPAHNLTDVRTHRHNSQNHDPRAVDLLTSRIYLRPHYPIPGFLQNDERRHTVSLIKSRDAALCPVRIDLNMLNAGTGWSSPGSAGWVLGRVTQAPNGVGSYLRLHQISGNWSVDFDNFTGTHFWTSQAESGQWTDLTGTWSLGEEITISEVRFGGQSPDPNSAYNGVWKVATLSEGYITTEVKQEVPYTGANYDEEIDIEMWTSSWMFIGKIENTGKGVKSNPLKLNNMQGMTIASTLNANAHVFSQTAALDRSLTLTHFGISKGGAYMSGILHQKIGHSYTPLTLSVSDSHESSNTNAHYGWMNSGEDNVTSGALNNGNPDLASFLQKTEGSVQPTPASSPNSGSPNFTEFGDYTYKVSYVYDGYQEGPLSTATFSIPDIPTEVTYSDYDINLTIVSPSKRLTSICLYRKNNINDLYRLVAEVPTDDTWVQNDLEYSKVIRDNGSLGATFDSRAGYSEVLTNPFAQYGMGISLNGYHFVGDCSHPQIKDASHMIFRSLPGQFDLFNWANDYLVLPTKPTAMANFAGRLYVFDENNTYRINPQTLVIEDTFEGSGCIGMNSILITEFGMFYCDRNNAYWHKGSAPQIISYSIKTGGDSDISSFNISDLSWEKTAGNKHAMAPKLIFDNKRNAILFFVEKTADSLVGFSRYYCWAFSLIRQRWDLWEVSTGDDGSGTFNADKVIIPTSVVTTAKGKSFITQGDFIIDYMGGTELRPWQYMSKKITVGSQSQRKVWKNIRLIGNDDDITSTSGNIKGAISIAVDGNVIGGSDKVFKKDTPDSKVTIKGSYKTGRYMQFLITKMKDSIDGFGIVFRRKGIK